MTEKRYTDMATIVQFCRIFGDQMHKCLENSRLTEDGYYLHLVVNGYDPSELVTVELTKHIDEVGFKEWDTTRMVQMRTKEGWMICNDPVREPGGIPTVVKSVCEKKSRDETAREKREPPYPADGLWIGADY